VEVVVLATRLNVGIEIEVTDGGDIPFGEDISDMDLPVVIGVADQLLDVESDKPPDGRHSAAHGAIS
jgi:hypothetical protein